MFDYSESDPGPGSLATTQLQVSTSRKASIRSTAWLHALLQLSLLASPSFAADLVKDRGAQDVYAYISNQSTDNVSVIDTGSNTLVATVAVGDNPFGVGVNPAGTRAYVGNFSSSNVSVIDTASNAVLATIAVGTGPIGVAVNPAGTRAYVANRTSSSVSVIGTADNGVIATVLAVGSSPRGLAVNPAGTRVYVAGGLSNDISIINTTSNSVIAVVPVGTQPEGVAVNPAGTRAYVGNFTSNNVSVIDTASNAVIATIPVGTAPRGVAINPAGTRAYVANSTSGNVSVIDTASNTVIATVAAGSSPRGVSVNPAGTHVYVANTSSGNVSVIDTATNSVTTTIGVGGGPAAFGLFIATLPAAATAPGAPGIGSATPGNGTATINFTAPASDGGSPIIGYTATCNPGSISDSGAASPITVDGLTNGTAYGCSVVATNGIGDGPASASVSVTPQAPQVQQAFAYIPNSANNNVSVIDTVTNTVVATVGVGDEPGGVTVNPAGTRVYVSNYLNGPNFINGSVSVIDTATNTVIDNMVTGRGTYSLAVNPAGTRLYVTNEGTDNVSVFDAATNAFVATVAVGSFPRGVVVNPSGTRVYVANNESNSVSVIDSATNVVVATVAVANSPHGVAINPSGTRVYVTRGSGGIAFVSVIDTATNTVVDTINVGGPQTGIAINASGTRAYVAVTGSNTVRVVDLASNASIANVAVGAAPLGISVNPSGSHVYVANLVSNDVSVIATSSNTVVATVAVGTSPFAFGTFIAAPPGVTPPTFSVRDADRFGDPAATGLAGVSVTLLSGAQVIDTATSNAQGNFSFNAAVNLSQPYTLRLAGFGLQRAYQAVVPANLGATSLVLPVDLHARLDAELVRLETTDIQVQKYTTTNARALLSNWSSAQPATAAVHAARDRALGRLLVASEGLADLYSGTQLLNVASAHHTVDLQASYLTAGRLVWDMYDAYQRRVNHGLSNLLAAIVRAMSLDVLAAIALTEKYHLALQDFHSLLPQWGQDQVGTGVALTAVGVLGAFQSAAWADIDGREAQLAAVVNRLSGDVGAAVNGSTYVEQTQNDFNLAVARAGALEGVGTVNAGYLASRQHATMVLQRNFDQALASEAVGSAREGWRSAALFVQLVTSPDETFPLEELFALIGGSLVDISVADLVKLGVDDYTMVADTAFHDAAVVAGRAFDPSLPAAVVPTVDPAVRSSPPSGAVVPSEYSTRLAALRGRLVANDRPGAIAEVEALAAADAALELAVESELLPLLALAAANPSQPLATAHRAALASAGVFAGQRVILYGRLAGYLIPEFADPATTDAVRIAQIDAVGTAITNFESALANAQAAAAGLTAPSHVLVPEHGLDNVSAPVQTPPGPIVIRARVVNAGQQAATGVTVALSFGSTPGPVPVALLTSPSVIELQTIPAGETRELTWTASASDTSAAGTGSAATYHIEVSATSGVADDADGSFEVLTSLVSIFGNGFEAPPL